VVLNDLGPAATFIAQGFNLPFDVGRFEKAARKILAEVEKELGWMWSTKDEDGQARRIDYTVWSEVLSCPECSGDVVFLEEALNEDDGSVRKSFPCVKRHVHGTVTAPPSRDHLHADLDHELTSIW
jgi:hypothetical protein